MSFNPGNYDDCNLKESVTSTTQKGLPQMVLTFSIGDSGQNRNVRFMLNNDTRGKDGKTNLERSIEQLQRLGFNGDFENPEFAAATGVTLAMKYGTYNGNQTEEWNLGFKHEKAAGNVLTDLNRSYRALAGSQPRPANAKSPAPSTPPARKGPAPSTVPAKEQPLDTSGVTDLQTAWDFATTNNPGLSETRWVEGIAAIAKKTKRKEEAFTVEDWRTLALDCSLPF